jgi:hypothetical protein
LPLKLEAKLNVPTTANTAEISKNVALNSKVNSGSEAIIGPGVSTTFEVVKTTTVAVAINTLPIQRDVIVLILLKIAQRPILSAKFLHAKMMTPTTMIQKVMARVGLIFMQQD